MKYRYRVLVFLFCLSILTFVDRVCISVLGKSMQEDLQLSPTHWVWMRWSDARPCQFGDDQCG